MTIKMVSTRQEFAVEDESGYRFHVVAEQDTDTHAWHAKVEMRTHGYVSAETALEHLAHVASEFVRIVVGSK